MQVNATNTNGIVKELESQRNNALSRAAIIAGQLAETTEALASAQKLIEELRNVETKQDAA